MNGTRILGAVCASILATSLGTLVACGGSDDKSASTVDPALTAKTVQAASVVVEIADAGGYKIGQATGTLIAPRVVLTSGHMISGQSKWVITTADGKKVAGSKGLTYDWRSYESDKAHPRKHDVGIIYLDNPISLDAYPAVLAEKSTVNATRIRSNGASFEAISSTLTWSGMSPNNYLADMPSSETLDTGGALINAKGIVGVVSGKGTTSGKLYIARTDELANWLNEKVSCGGGSSDARTFAVGAPKQQICDDAGNPIGSSTSGSSSGNPGNGTSGSTGDNGGTCPSTDTNGIDSKTGSGTSSTSLNPSSNPSSDSNGGSGTTGSNTGTGGSNAGSSGSNGSTNGGTTGSNSGGAGNTGSDTNGGSTTGNTGSGNNNGSTNGGSGTNGSNSGGAGSSGSNSSTPIPSVEPCQGPSDNPDTCPPEADACSGANCGGGNPALDQTIDFGTCACGARSGSTNVK